LCICVACLPKSHRQVGKIILKSRKFHSDLTCLFFLRKHDAQLIIMKLVRIRPNPKVLPLIPNLDYPDMATSFTLICTFLLGFRHSVCGRAECAVLPTSASSMDFHISSTIAIIFCLRPVGSAPPTSTLHTPPRRRSTERSM
jgi:hypothetical protein